MKPVLWSAVLSTLVASAIYHAAAHAQPAAAYPVKPVRLIVPLAPGGPSDIMARTVAQKLSENIKQTVLVDNRPGASATIGTEIAAKSPPDGYTIIRSEIEKWAKVIKSAGIRIE